MNITIIKEEEKAGTVKYSDEIMEVE